MCRFFAHRAGNVIHWDDFDYGIDGIHELWHFGDISYIKEACICNYISVVLSFVSIP